MSTPDRPHVVVMGVSGTGKSTVGEELARRHGRGFVEGDDYHPPANVAKMRAGRPLTDEDRWPWLEALAQRLDVVAAGEPRLVVSCSALRRAYRDLLRRGRPDGALFFLHLDAAESVLVRRMEGREHFMPSTLLRSQLDALEPLGPDEHGAVVDVDRPLPEVVSRSARALGEDPVG